MRYSVIAILVAGLLATGPALAASQSRDEARDLRVSQLERRAEVLQRRINGPQKLGASERSELRRQQSEVRKMIEQLERGGAVEPEEMDRIQGR